MAISYWGRVLAQRLNRRRTLAAAGASAVGAALLAACGGGDEGGGGGSGLLTVPKDTSDKAVAGGIWQTSSPDDPSPNVDAHKTTGTTAVSRITENYDFIVKYGLGTEGRNGPIAPDAAEAWEFSPDGLTLTFKMRPNHVFDPRPPTSGRSMTAADVKFSWDRFIAFSPSASDVKPDNPSSPVASLNAPDDKTIVVKLKFPYLSTLEIFAHHRYMMIMPRESDGGGFDPRSETRGAGPFYLEKWTPSVSLEWKKKPGWYEKGRPYLDGVMETIIPNSAAALSQFEAGALWDGTGYRPDNVLQIKRAHPQMIMQQTFPSLSGNSAYALSYRPESIFRDQRARQAASMLVDRDLFLEVTEATDQFTSEGLPVDVRWNSHIPSPNPEWLDPKRNQLGEGSKYFHYNVAEAKKLLSAAGYKGEPMKLHFSERQNAREYEILHGMWKEALNIDIQVLEYATTWRQVCQTSAGTDYVGICYNPGTGFNAEEHIVRWYTPEGRFRYSTEETPVLTPLARKIRVELDRERQIELIKQFQREAATIMPLVMSIGETTGFDLHWPWLENFGVWTGFNSAKLWAYNWYNKSKHTTKAS